MFVTAVNAILLAIASLGLSRIILGRSPTLIFLSRACLILSIIMAPLFLKGIIVVLLLVMPTCWKWHQAQRSHCSQLCIARSVCALRQS